MASMHFIGFRHPQEGDQLLHKDPRGTMLREGTVAATRQGLDVWMKSLPQSLDIFLAPNSGPGIPESNWLPSPDGKPFSLTFRTYVPKDIVESGEWFPPAIRKIQ